MTPPWKGLSEEAHRRRVRISARAGVGVLVVLTAASITAAILAFAERNNAQPVAESRALAGEALADFGSSELDRGLLLSLQAYSISPTVQARASLVQGLEDAGSVVRFLHVPVSGPAFALSGSVRSLAFSPDGKTLAVGTGSKVYRWDVASGRRIGKPLHGRAPGPATKGRALRWWWRQILKNPPGPVSCSTKGLARGRVAICPLGLIAAAGSSRMLRRSVALWNAKRAVGPASTAIGPFVSPDGKVVAVGTLGGTVLRWDVTSRLVAAPALGGLIDGGDATTNIAFSPDGKLLAAADSAGTVTLFDLAASQFARLTPASPLGQKTTPGCGVSAGAALAGQGRPPKGQPSECGYCAEPCAYAVSPGGGVTAVAVQGEEQGPDVFLWSSRTRRVFAHLRIANPALNAVHAIAFSPDGETLAVSAGGVFDPAEETVTLWDVATGVQLGRPLVGPPHGGPIRFSTDGQSLTQFGTQGTVTWSLPLGRNIGAVRARVCDLVGRNLTRSEWQQFGPNQSYRKTCPQWP